MKIVDQKVLAKSIGKKYWQKVLAKSIGKKYWQKVLAKSIGKSLIDWISAEGKRFECKISLSLDSYVSIDKSHHFYFRKGCIIKGFHFYKEIH